MPARKGVPIRHPALSPQQNQAITKLAGKPIRMEGQTPLSDSQKAALLVEQIRKLKYPSWNPYKTSFTLFRTQLCWTRDEARGGRVALMPDYPYLRQMDRALVEKTPLFFEKARRMLFTWEMIAFALWVMAGGQDPAWPALMESDKNRKVIFAARKLEGEAGSADLLERLRFMVDEFDARGGREAWPQFPEFEWRFDRARASNGSIASAVPQGGDSMRGPGTTLIIADELAFWTEAKSSVESALQTLHGGGHFVAGSSANFGSHAALIVKGELNRQRSRLERARTYAGV